MVHDKVSYLLIGPSYVSATKNEQKKKKKKKNEKMNNLCFWHSPVSYLADVLPYAGSSVSLGIAREMQVSL